MACAGDPGAVVGGVIPGGAAVHRSLLPGRCGRHPAAGYRIEDRDHPGQCPLQAVRQGVQPVAEPPGSHPGGAAVHRGLLKT